MDEKKVVKEYLEGLSSLKLAKKYGCSKEKILNILKNNNIERRTTKYEITEEIKNLIITKYKEKEPIKNIVKVSGACEKRIYEILKNENLIRNKNKKISLEVEKEICYKFLNGKTNKQLCEEYGIWPGTISKILDKNGIKRKRMAYNKIDEKTRKKVINEYVNGLNICEISEKYGFGTTTIARWIKNENKTRSFSDAFTLSAQKGRKFFKGTDLPYFSTKSNKWFFADSLWEGVRMSQLDNDENVLYWEKCTDRIPYFDDNGKQHYYIPDIKIYTKYGETIVEEIKPKDLTNNTINTIKFNYAKKFYDAINIKFLIVTENEIGINNIKSFNPDGLMKLTKEKRERLKKDKRNEHLRKQRAEKNTNNRKSIEQCNI